MDLDGVGDVCDNCPYYANLEQIDTDEDGTGDACDESLDMDADGVYDGLDNCMAISNPEQEDADADGVGDVCDMCATITTCPLRDPLVSTWAKFIPVVTKIWIVIVMMALRLSA